MHTVTEGQREVICVSCMYVFLSGAIPCGIALLLEMVQNSVLSFLKATHGKPGYGLLNRGEAYT